MFLNFTVVLYCERRLNCSLYFVIVRGSLLPPMYETSRRNVGYCVAFTSSTDCFSEIIEQTIYWVTFYTNVKSVIISYCT